jgi:hypothetical protein
MKLSRSDVRKKAHAIPILRFENQTLTSFSGLVVFQALFARLQLKARLAQCFRSLGNGKTFDRATIFLQLIVHFLLGYRELRHACHYQDDPLVKRVLGLNRLPDVSTLSRMLGEATAHTVENLRLLLRGTVLDRLRILAPPRITLDFDGSVLSTSRHAEGTAVGFNKKKKGARSYYPLFCTIPQFGQVFDLLHRPGNVHDSHGAKAFILQCIERVRQVAPWAIIEVRLDSAFFSDEIVSALDGLGVEFTISVPFERFCALKRLVEERRHWQRIDGETSYFESEWKPESWPHRYRFLFIRTLAKKQHKGPVQLDLFVPHEYGYEFKVIVTNKTVRCRSVVHYHEGRGAQESVFAELKSHCHLGYIPVRTLCGNQTYLLAGLFAYNLTRELQMQTTEPIRGTTGNRAALWVFEKVDTLRKTVLQRAGSLSRPGGILTLTIAGGRSLRERISQLLPALHASS